MLDGQKAQVGLMKKRTGKNADDIFASTPGRPSSSAPKPAIVLGRDWTVLRFEVLGYDLVLALRPRSSSPILDRLWGLLARR